MAPGDDGAAKAAWRTSNLLMDEAEEAGIKPANFCDGSPTIFGISVLMFNLTKSRKITFMIPDAIN